MPCVRISKGTFLTAMVVALDPVARDNAIKIQLDSIAVLRGQKLAARKERIKKLRTLTAEEIEAVLAARKETA